jgi:hypothetical protein
VFVDPTGKLITFANAASEEAFWQYWDTLDVNSIDYQNLMQLEDSDIEYVVNVAGTGPDNEGSVTFDGERVFVNVDPTRPAEDASIGSRFAHEFQHALQIDNGELGFRNNDGRWSPIFNDIYDEVGAFEAQLRQAQEADFHRGIIRGFSNAEGEEERAIYLINNNYSQYSGRENVRANAPNVPGFQPGQLLHTGNMFYRIPR